MEEAQFFNPVARVPVPWKERNLCTPTFYYDVMAIDVTFMVPTRRVLAYLPSPRMYPVPATPWHSLLNLSAINYRSSDIGPYNEMVVAFLISLDKPVRLFKRLFRSQGDQPSAYIVHMPVTTAIALDAGIDFYNFPKFLASIEFTRSRDWIECRLSAGDSRILSLSVRELPLKPVDRSLLQLISVRDERLLRSELSVSPCQQGTSRRQEDVRLTLGDHPIAQELRQLKLSH